MSGIEEFENQVRSADSINELKEVMIKMAEWIDDYEYNYNEKCSCGCEKQ